MKIVCGRLFCLVCILLVCGSASFAQQQPWKAPEPLPPRQLLDPPKDYNFVHSPSIPCGEEGVDLSYKIPLSPQQEKRALDIYRKSVVVLGHSHCVEEFDFEEMRKAGVTAVIIKPDTDGMNFINGTRAWNLTNENWLQRGMRSLDRLVEMAERPENRLLIARTTADIRKAKRENKVAIILSFEGAKPLAGKIENVGRYHKQGLRELQLFWAVPNELKTENGRGLSTFGEQVVGEMNRLGIVIDTSHMAAEALGRVLELSTQPIIISHGAVRALQGGNPTTQTPGGEKLSGSDIVNDIGLRALARNGGVLCLHFVTPDYIKPRHGTRRGSVADWVDHAAYIRDLVGIDHVALGPDYFPERGWHWIEGAGQIALLPNVAREMVRRGFSDEEIAKVLGGNLMRVLEKNWEAR